MYRTLPGNFLALHELLIARTIPHTVLPSRILTDVSPDKFPGAWLVVPIGKYSFHERRALHGLLNRLSGVIMVDPRLQKEFPPGPRILHLKEDLGQSLFRRYAVKTQKPKRFSRKTVHFGYTFDPDEHGHAAPDQEPEQFRLLAEFFASTGYPLVVAGVSPAVKSWSIGHDTEDQKCLRSGKKIVEFNQSYGVRSTFYLRQFMGLGDFTDHHFYKIQKPYTPQEAFRALSRQGTEFGYHGESATWIALRAGGLPAVESHGIALSYLRRELSEEQIQVGSTHMGNHGEVYPQDFRALAQNRITLWRNSFRFNGLTPMRPYLLYDREGNTLSGIWGQMDDVIDDLANLTLERPNHLGHPPQLNQKRLERAIETLKSAPDGHLFFHSHPHNFDDVAGTPKNYAAVYQALKQAEFSNITSNELVGYWQKRSQVVLQPVAMGSGARVRVRNSFSGLVLACYAQAALEDETGTALRTRILYRTHPTIVQVI
ncbi:hypothetical protein HYW32_00225 [Candidatus Berkelbacteria bacterium]|nr:hypothetical protein [Candidatus Berkelbacteria bacterium]